MGRCRTGPKSLLLVAERDSDFVVDALELSLDGMLIADQQENERMNESRVPQDVSSVE